MRQSSCGGDRKPLFAASRRALQILSLTVRRPLREGEALMTSLGKPKFVAIGDDQAHRDKHLAMPVRNLTFRILPDPAQRREFARAQRCLGIAVHLHPPVPMIKAYGANGAATVQKRTAQNSGGVPGKGPSPELRDNGTGPSTLPEQRRGGTSSSRTRGHPRSTTARRGPRMGRPLSATRKSRCDRVTFCVLCGVDHRRDTRAMREWTPAIPGAPPCLSPPICESLNWSACACRRTVCNWLAPSIILR
jgi:hypothetical protein